MGRRPILGEQASSLTALRLPDELNARIDAYAEDRGIEQRSEAIRQLLTFSLDAHEKRRRTTMRRKR
jgi:metal-responsive CopG/Arc/MetJ family transcriptional regulator